MGTWLNLLKWRQRGGHPAFPKIELQCSASLEQIRELGVVVGPTVSELIVTLDPEWDMDHACTEINWAAFTNLKELTIVASIINMTDAREREVFGDGPPSPLPIAPIATERLNLILGGVMTGIAAVSRTQDFTRAIGMYLPNPQHVAPIASKASLIHIRWTFWLCPARRGLCMNISSSPTARLTIPVISSRTWSGVSSPSSSAVFWERRSLAKSSIQCRAEELVDRVITDSCEL
jgi:hypothetical protein